MTLLSSSTRCFRANTSSGISGVGTRKCFCLATTTVTAVVAIAIGNLLVKEVSAHGRLIEPPSRASMWRYGFDTPHDYNDHESYCGGFTRQWQRNGGKCGICGDAWDTKTPRAHETGGKYGTGVIVRRYRTGATIPIKVELTANHRGYFEFRTCGMKYRNQEVNQECLDENLLTGDNGTARYYPGEGNHIFEAEYKLPDGLTCAWCVFQWRYIAGNNWGQCPDGTGAVGCGPQEEFRACADIAIGDDVSPLPPRPKPTKRPTTPAAPTEPQQPSSTESSDYSPGQGEPLWLYNFVIADTQSAGEKQKHKKCPKGSVCDKKKIPTPNKDKKKKPNSNRKKVPKKPNKKKTKKPKKKRKWYSWFEDLFDWMF